MALATSTADFIRGAFPSVWALELLLLMNSQPDRGWTRQELVEKLRASDPIIVQGVSALVAGGLVAIEDGGCVRFSPASPEIARLVEDALREYAKRPNTVRRLIVFAGQSGLQAFSDAFKLRGD